LDHRAPRSHQPITSDADLQAVTVGERKPHDAPIALAEYDPRWPQMFEREAARIRTALGDTMVRLEHTGSTSVPGLAAKPIIDITLIVPDSADEAAYVPQLEAAGYTLRIGTSTGCSRVPTPTSISTSSAPGTWSWSGWSASATGSAGIRKTANSTN
jgi:GrpB-like predicted nucleotidyltransferase (UPF0157 family)